MKVVTFAVLETPSSETSGVVFFVISKLTVKVQRSPATASEELLLVEARRNKRNKGLQAMEESNRCVLTRKLSCIPLSVKIMYSLSQGLPWQFEQSKQASRIIEQGCIKKNI